MTSPETFCDDLRAAVLGALERPVVHDAGHHADAVLGGRRVPHGHHEEALGQGIDHVAQAGVQLRVQVTRLRGQRRPPLHHRLQAIVCHLERTKGEKLNKSFPAALPPHLLHNNRPSTVYVSRRNQEHNVVSTWHILN